MNKIDSSLIQSALRSIERALETTKGDPDAVRYFNTSVDLINAKYALRAALIGNVPAEASQSVVDGAETSPAAQQQPEAQAASSEL